MRSVNKQKSMFWIIPWSNQLSCVLQILNMGKWDQVQRCWFRLFESVVLQSPIPFFFRTNPIPITKNDEYWLVLIHIQYQQFLIFFKFFFLINVEFLYLYEKVIISLAQIVLLFTAPSYSSTYFPIADNQSEVLHIPWKPLTSMMQNKMDWDRKKGFVCDSCLCMCGFMCVGCGSISMCGWLWLAVTDWLLHWNYSISDLIWSCSPKILRLTHLSVLRCSR